MLKIISDPKKLQQSQTQFIAQLDGMRTELIPDCLISWRPESLKAAVNWSSRIKIWWYSQLVSGTKNRWWNAFGTTKPISNQTLHIDCEINPPVAGISRNIGATFVEQENGRIFIVHRGNKWGGGKKGITKTFFWSNYEGRQELVKDGDRVTNIAVIGELGNAKLPFEVSNFVYWIQKLKTSV